MMTTELPLDHSGLRWIRQEVEENLRQARFVLEDFVAGDVENLATAIRSLHLVRGALTLAQIHGAAMLADELERLARSMNEGRVGNREAAAEVLMLGIAQLPAYLDRIETGEPDIPLILLPLMNDLRTARDAPLVSEASLFAPRLDAQLAAEPVEPGSGNPRMPELVARLRMDYHRALLKWLRDLDVPGGLKVLRGLIDRVSSAAGTARLRRLLDAAEALLVAIAEGSVQATSDVKLLYGQLDRVFKRVIEQGEEAVANDFPVELLKSFLYYIARSDSSDPVVLAVRRAADLANSFPDLSEEELRTGRFIGAGRELFETVAQALDEELLRIKDQLDLYMRGDHRDLERFASLAEPIRRTADTLGMIGQGRLRSRLVPHADMIRDVVEKGEPPDDAQLDQLAWDLLSVQSALPMLSASGSSQNAAEADEAVVPEGEYRQYLKVALDQVFVELARVKEALSVCFDSGEVASLQPVPVILHRLAGVFRVLEQPAVSDLFARLQAYVEALLSGEREAPDTGERESLGDMISGIEVYLESLLEPSPDRQRALLVAGEAADQLGLAESHDAGEQVEDEAPVAAVEAVDEVPVATDEPEDEAPVVEDESADEAPVATVEPVDETPVVSVESEDEAPVVADEPEDEVPVAAAEPADEAPVAVGEPADEAPIATDEPEDEIPVVAAEPEDEAADAEPSAPAVEVVEVAGDESIAVKALEEPEREPVEEAEQPEAVVSGESDSAAEGSGSSMLDSEILSIFIEEAREELESLQTHFPVWRENPADREALTCIRRSFHTLKGSGRLVGALEIGEFAWALENLLNRVIDGTREADAGVLATVEEAVALLPMLIEARESGGAAVDGVLALQARADALAAGESVEPSTVEAESTEPPTVEAESVEPPAVEAESTEPPTVEAESVEPPAVEAEPAEPPAVEAEPAEAPAEEAEPAEVPAVEAESAETSVVEAEPVETSAAEAEPAEASVTADESREGASESAEALEVVLDGEAADGEIEADIEPSILVLDEDEESEEGDGLSSLLYAETRDQEDESILKPAMAEPPPIELDETLHQIFVREAESHLAVMEAFIGRCRGIANGCVFDDELRRVLHTLHGSAYTAQITSVAELAGALERWANLCHRLERRTDQAAIDLLERGHYVINALLAAINVPGSSMPSWQVLVKEIELAIKALEGAEETRPGNTADQPGDTAESYDEELVAIFVDEARELLDRLESGMADWQARPDDLLPVVHMQRGLHTIKGGARLSGVLALGDLSHAMESLLESVADQRIQSTPDIVRLTRQALDVLATQIEALEGGRAVKAQEVLIEHLQAAAQGKPFALSVLQASEVLDDLSVPFNIEGVVDDQSLPLHIEETLDSQSIQLNIEEALDSQSVQPNIEETLDTQSVQPNIEETLDTQSVQLNIEDDASELELLDDTELETLEQTASGLTQSTLLTDSQLLTDSELLMESDLVSTSSMIAVGDGESMAGGAVDSRIIQFPTSALLDRQDEPPRRPPPPPEEEKSTTSKERVRVRADLLDQMVNNAGEVSIYGARLEQQNKTLGYNLDELTQTIGRLREQLRKLEIETEAQILSRHQREHEGDLPDGFDPLEMDRYSTIQQLSRALAETTEDLNSISVTLQEQSRDTDTLLQQQSRVINDLQDGLLRTRMIPVGSRASRLQRVVRQTAEAVGKQAELTLTGAAGEMDRAILERMMGPLEHLLRNAVAHGIEAPAEREAAGKSPTGKVSLVVSRDGSDVVLEVSDDGRGLDREAIRRKAIERGLLDPEAPIDDDDLDAFILEAGLSTANQVTQVAGRGVGMDVVVNEIKQLGGTLEIDSQPGSGTRFTIRLPFTLAISEALLVGIEDEVFAVPHGSLAGIARIPRSELAACYRSARATFSYGGQEYTVRYLGGLLGTGVPHLPEGERWMPLLLVHSGEHRMAIQVDRLLGNRQIVVKSLGAQLASIRWFTGGTILADGSIALILDIGALVRMESTRQVVPESLVEAEEEEAVGVKVMVVDDSITVRKVTSRLLERHNMQVITARDGVDAVTLLQTERPDVMLLDIEMPRMDGFELARHMRSTEGLKDIPIIMITSRTGDKHRQHAQELGVRRYLGKPYQEAELLENIYTVLAEVTS